jgi:hypothetical protein
MILRALQGLSESECIQLLSHAHPLTMALEKEEIKFKKKTKN